MTAGLPGFGGSGYVSQESRALSSIADTPGADLSQGQEEQIKMLRGHDYQIKFLAEQMKQAQQGITEANQNPIQQIQQFVSDIIVLLGGGELLTGALDFGDLQYILPALGALFGFGDGPFPISLFEAAQKFFLGYVVPQQQFVEVINGIIQAWLGTLGIDPDFISDIKSLVTAFGDLFDGVGNLLPSLNELFGALGITGNQLGPLGQVLGPLINLFTEFDLTKFGSIIEFITDAIDPFVEQLTAIINWINSILAVFGFHGAGGVVNSPIGSTTLPFANLASLFGLLDFTSPDFDIADVWANVPVIGPFMSTIFAAFDGIDLTGGPGAVVDSVQSVVDGFAHALLSALGSIPIIGSIIESIGTFILAAFNNAVDALQAATVAGGKVDSITEVVQAPTVQPGWVAGISDGDVSTPFNDLPTSDTITVTSTNAPWALVKCTAAEEKRMISFVALKQAGVTDVYADLYKLAPNGDVVQVWACPNIVADVPTAEGPVTITIPPDKAAAVVAGDWIGVQLSKIGTGNVVVRAKNSTATRVIRPFRNGAARNPSTERAPALIAAGTFDSLYAYPTFYAEVDHLQVIPPSNFYDDCNRATL